MAFKMSFLKLRLPDQHRGGLEGEHTALVRGKLPQLAPKDPLFYGRSWSGVWDSLGSGGESGVLMWGFSEPV